MQKKSDVQKMALVGVMSALVFVFSMVSIQIGEISRFHFGNAMCLLSGLLFGPIVGGLASGIGSMLYDFTNPLYAPEFWITFITKFMIGFVAGTLAHKVLVGKFEKARYAIASTVGAFTYVALYLLKSAIQQHYIMGNPWNVVLPILAGKAAISSINALISIGICIVFAPLLQAALSRAGLFTNKTRPHHHS